MIDGKSIKKLVGTTIKELRIKDNITQEKLSEHIGLQPNGLTQIETGRNFISSEVLAKLCQYFDVSPAVFFTPNPQYSFDEHINYSKEIIGLLPTFSQEKLQEIYNILLVMKK